MNASRKRDRRNLLNTDRDQLMEEVRQALKRSAEQNANQGERGKREPGQDEKAQRGQKDDRRKKDYRFPELVKEGGSARRERKPAKEARRAPMPERIQPDAERRQERTQAAAERKPEANKRPRAAAPQKNAPVRADRAKQPANGLPARLDAPARRGGKGGREKGLKILFFGGVGEIGKNMTALEYGNDILIIDAGITFPSEDMPGIDLVLPDISYLVQNKEKIRGVVVTHGHEDHVGGLPYLLKEINTQVYATKLTLAIAENKMREHRVSTDCLKTVTPGSVVKLGCFSVEFINVNHSIAGSVALAVTTPVGVVYHSGDYKIDHTPVSGETMDLTRIAEIGKQGVLLMMAESTNVERQGFTMSEKVVGETLDHLFADNLDRRLIIATFASNVHRIQQIIDLAVKYRRKVVFSGRSMINVADAASKIGELRLPKGVVVDVDKIRNMPDKELVILSTGSQGEPMSALTRMAAGEFREVKIGGNDTVILSASPIPGNEKMVYRVINNLYRLGAKVVYESLEKIHVSGHACQEELKMLHTLVKPKFFIPVHGEYRHLCRHVDLAASMGMRRTNTLIADIGNSVLVTPNSMKFGESFPAGSRLVDGLDIDDGESVVLRDRRHLSEDGLFVVVVGISAETGEVVSGPDIINKGVVTSDEQLLADARACVLAAIYQMDAKSIGDKGQVYAAIRRSLKNFLFRKTKKNPMILPVVMEV